jgi:biotin carboxyl carrier protein
MATQVLAPLPGIFFRRPSPDEPPFVEEGGRIAAGETIGLVEIMKTFFPVKADAEGTVIRFVVADGDTVEADDLIAEVE